MDGIWEVEKLKLFLIFFIPGFISIKVYGLLVADKKVDFSKSIYEAIGYSCLNFAAFFWLLNIIHSPGFFDSHTLWYYILFSIVLFITPMTWPILYCWITKHRFLSKYLIDPIKSPWDKFFSNGKSYWVLVHLKDGRVIGGKYARKSFASSYPRKQEIYLEEVWKLDANKKFVQKIDRTEGIIILRDEIIALEFFN